MISLVNTAAYKYDAYLNLGDWKLSLKDNPGYCLFAAYDNSNLMILAMYLH